MTPQTYTFPVATLRAVLLAVPGNDVRYYLKGIQVEPAADRVALVGTDGARLHCVVCDTPGAAGAPFIVPAEMLTNIVKGAKKGADVTVIATPRDGRHELELRRDDGLAVRGESVDGTFPDWHRIVPDQVMPDGDRVAHFNYELLADVQKAAALLLGRKTAYVHVAHRGPANSALVTCADLPDFFAVVMPMRLDRTGPGGHAATAHAALTRTES